MLKFFWTQEVEKKHPQKYGSLKFLFSLQPRQPKTAHFHFINSFIQPSLVGSLEQNDRKAVSKLYGNVDNLAPHVHIYGHCWVWDKP